MLLTIQLLLILSFTYQIKAQSVPYASSYKVHKGDSMTYQFTKVQNKSNDYYANLLPLQNGTFITIKVTQGTKMVVKIADINETTGPNYTSNGTIVQNMTFQQVYCQEIYYIGSKQYVTQVYQNQIFIMEAFDNMSMVNNYVYYMNSINSQNQPYYPIYNFSANSNYLIINENLTNLNGPNNNYTYYSNLVYNWKTGWLQSLYEKEYNGSEILFDLELALVANKDNNILNDSINMLSKDGFYIILFGITVAIGGLFIYTWIGYKKSKSLTTTSKSSFSSYIKTNIRKKRSKQNATQPELGKSLNIIEEILNENK